MLIAVDEPTDMHMRCIKRIVHNSLLGLPTLLHIFAVLLIVIVDRYSATVVQQC